MSSTPFLLPLLEAGCSRTVCSEQKFFLASRSGPDYCLQVSCSPQKLRRTPDGSINQPTPADLHQFRALHLLPLHSAQLKGTRRNHASWHCNSPGNRKYVCLLYLRTDTRSDDFRLWSSHPLRLLPSTFAVRFGAPQLANLLLAECRTTEKYSAGRNNSQLTREKMSRLQH